MAGDYFVAGDYGAGKGVESPVSQGQRANPLSSKVTSVLSTNYTDSDVRDALALLDSQNLVNTAETRRRLRLNVQKEVIVSNSKIIHEFGHVAEVCPFPIIIYDPNLLIFIVLAITENWLDYCQSEK